MVKQFLEVKFIKKAHKVRLFTEAHFQRKWMCVHAEGSKLEERNFNIIMQLSSIIKAFEDFRFVQELREEILKVSSIAPF